MGETIQQDNLCLEDAISLIQSSADKIEYKINMAGFYQGASVNKKESPETIIRYLQDNFDSKGIINSTTKARCKAVSDSAGYEYSISVELISTTLGMATDFVELRYFIPREQSKNDPEPILTPEQVNKIKRVIREFLKKFWR